MSSSDRDTAVRRGTPCRSGCTRRSPARRPRELAASLAWELGDLDADRVERALTRCAPRRRPSSSATAEDQLRALGEAVALRARSHGGGPESPADRPRARARPRPPAPRRDPARRDSAAAPACRSASSPASTATSSPTSASPSRSCSIPSTGQLVDADALGAMHWRCGHQVAAELLDLLQPRYERIGDLTRALHVARLRTHAAVRGHRGRRAAPRAAHRPPELAAWCRPCTSVRAPSPAG